MLLRRPALLVLAVAGSVLLPAAPALAHDTGAHAARTALQGAPATEGSAVSMRHVANLPHQTPTPTTAQNGSDIEFVTVRGRDYALAGTLRNGLQVVDVTDPSSPQRVARYDCPITQGDVQVFRQGTRVLASYTADSALGSGSLTSACVTEANALGAGLDGTELGTFLVDLTDPARPRTAGFFEVPEGSHNQTVHPSGDYLYNSNSDLLTSGSTPKITIHDIRDPARPRLVQEYRIPFVPTSLGSESHDIHFRADGTRAYVAALSQTMVLDTSDPEAPVMLSQIVDPTINVVHQSDVVRLPRRDGTERELLIITDEQAGAAGSVLCPGGGLHVYDVTGPLERRPAKLGAWFIRDATVTAGGVCTSHVLRLHPDQRLLTIAWYTRGVRVLDISGLAELQGSPVAVGIGSGVGMVEVGSYVMPDADTWSFKTNRIERDGSFFGFGNDLARGLDVYRFDGRLSVPAHAPEDLSAGGCLGVPVATAMTDRGAARGVHQRALDCVVQRSIARGSVEDQRATAGETQAPGRRVYRPREDVTRGQMATFILGTLRAAGIDHELPAPRTGAFDDVEGSVHRGAIEVLAAAGIVQGTAGGTSYAPQAPVTRDQMASFVVRAAQFAVDPDLVERGARRFLDVPDSSPHAASIAIGDDNGLFQGTTTSTFSPRTVVQRDQMASFLTRLLDVAGRGNAVPTGLG